MKLLAIDTASTIASVALVDDDRVLAETRSDTSGHRADLLLLVDAVCTTAAITAHDLDAIAIGAGPGSFTGLRIGMATAKGIAFATHRPLWAVSSLAALAHHELAQRPDGLVIAVLDAKRGEVYAGAYRSEGGRVVTIGDERVMPPADVAAFAAAARQGDERVQLVGEANGATPNATSVAALALAGSRVDVLVRGAPTYIRPSEAEIKYPDGVPGALRKRS